MKTHSFFILILQLIISNHSYTQNIAPLEGRTFSYKISETCKDGIDTLMVYETFDFDKDNVTISFQVKENVIHSYQGSYKNIYQDQTKKYKYTLDKNQIKIENHETFDILILEDFKIKTLDSQIILLEETNTKKDK